MQEQLVVKGVTHAPSISFDAYVWNSLTVRSDFSFNEVRQDGSKQIHIKFGMQL